MIEHEKILIKHEKIIRLQPSKVVTRIKKNITTHTPTAPTHRSGRTRES